jgi:hypothetical protein
MTNLRICSTAFLTSPLKEEGGQVSEVRIAYLAVQGEIGFKKFLIIGLCYIRDFWGARVRIET